MTKEELSKWLINKFNSCYTLKHDYYPNRIFYYNDEQFVRKIKLCKLNEQEIKLPRELNGICLFEHDLEYETLYCDTKLIWVFLEDYYMHGYREIQLFIKETLEEKELFVLPGIRTIIKYSDGTKLKIYDKRRIK